MIIDSLLQETQSRFDPTDWEERLKCLKQGASLLSFNRPEQVRKRLSRLGITSAVPAKALEGVVATETVRGVETEVRIEPATLVAEDLGPVAPIDELALERVLGKNDLMNINYLNIGLQRAKAVGRISIRDRSGRVLGFGTGFMVSPRLLLTNNHVLGDDRIAALSRVEFNAQEDAAGQPLTPTVFDLDPYSFFMTDRGLDFTLVAVQPASADGVQLSRFGWLKLFEETGKVLAGEYLSVIQHPNGEIKQVALRENQLISVLDDFLQYHTDTAPGSSGSPVFNDGWEVVALHHSGVPARDEAGRILNTLGQPWDTSQGEQRVKWIANEGVRISQIMKAVHRAKFPSTQARLKDEFLNSSPPLISPETAPGYALAAGGLQPLQISIHFGPQGPQAATMVPAAQVIPQSAPRIQPIRSTDEFERAISEARTARNRLYYDINKDKTDRTAYFNGLEARASREAFFRALSDLVRRSHKNLVRYSPATKLYPWIDLQPNYKIKSIYTGQEYAAEDLIREDFRILQERDAAATELRLCEAAMPYEKLQEDLDLLEVSLPYNCEHSIPQSWFSKQEPMRGDLHHLFACDSGCNSFRGNTPYYDFPDFEEAVRSGCGKRIGNKFEPSHGKGAVARAVLYFLLRYPGEINRTSNEYESERLETIIAWHKAESPDKWELHRNQAIFEAQGNRNPFIDRPEWADEVDFSLGLG